jgi:hypothetical protein
VHPPLGELAFVSPTIYTRHTLAAFDYQLESITLPDIIFQQALRERLGFLEYSFKTPEEFLLRIELGVDDEKAILYAVIREAFGKPLKAVSESLEFVFDLLHRKSRPMNSRSASQIQVCRKTRQGGEADEFC